VLWRANQFYFLSSSRNPYIIGWTFLKKNFESKYNLLSQDTFSKTHTTRKRNHANQNWRIGEIKLFIGCLFLFSNAMGRSDIASALTTQNTINVFCTCVVIVYVCSSLPHSEVIDYLTH